MKELSKKTYKGAPLSTRPKAFSKAKGARLLKKIVQSSDSSGRQLTASSKTKMTEKFIKGGTMGLKHHVRFNKLVDKNLVDVKQDVQDGEVRRS